MIQGMFNSGSLPVLERLLQFTEQRQAALAHANANLSTPGVRPADLSVADFQAALRQAIDQRRASAAGVSGPLALRDTAQLHFRPDRLDAIAEPTNDNVLFHDDNNRDVERLMQHLAENALMHRTGIELMRSEFSRLQTAIRGRV